MGGFASVDRLPVRLFLFDFFKIFYFFGFGICIGCHVPVENSNFVALQLAGFFRPVGVLHIHGRDLAFGFPLDDANINEIVNYDIVLVRHFTKRTRQIDDAPSLPVITDHNDRKVRREELACGDSNPVVVRCSVVGQIYREDVVVVMPGGQRRPDDMFSFVPPTDPSWRPTASWNPVPANIIGVAPTAVVVSRPSKRFFGNPHPTIPFCVNPVPHSIRVPVL